MNKLLHVGILCLLLVFVVGQVRCPGDGQKVTTTSTVEWQLTWNDEFEKAEIDRSKWTFDLGNGFVSNDIWISGWGNNELECYSQLKENVHVQNGKLMITALAKQSEDHGHPCYYTSARLKTKALFSQTYGKFEASIKLPAGKGLWPAFWMLPENDVYGTWAASGEIDIMEARGSNPSQVGAAIHYGGQWPQNVYRNKAYNFLDGQSITDFHVYAIEWKFGEIKWYVDGFCYFTQKEWFSQSPNKSERNPFPTPFDQPFFILLNLAIGGNYDGSPNENTTFPQTMEVDYVRVYNYP